MYTAVSIEFSERIRPISVNSVRPLYGPVAGGTRVTITGQLPRVSIITAVYIGQHEGIIDTQRLAIVSFIVYYRNLYTPFILVSIYFPACL